MDDRAPDALKAAIPGNGLSGECYAPVWHPRVKEDVEKLREDREMIKGLANGNFEDGERHYLVQRKDGKGAT